MILTNNPTHLLFFLNNFIFNFIFNIIPNPDLVSKSGPEKQLQLSPVLLNKCVLLDPDTPVLAGCLALLSFTLYFVASSLPPSLPHVSPSSLSNTHTSTANRTLSRGGSACKVTLARACFCQTNQHTWFTYGRPGASLSMFRTRQEGKKRLVGERRRAETRWGREGKPKMSTKEITVWMNEKEESKQYLVKDHAFLLLQSKIQIR